MAHITDYTFSFNSMTRMGNDICCLDQNSIQNSASCSYLLQNYVPCDMSRAMQLATTQPSINYTGGHGMGFGGCNVDTSSKLLIGGIQTNPKTKVDLFHRPFATVPYLGRGASNPILESQLQQGQSVTNRRTITNLGEKNLMKFHTTPLINEMKQYIQNPNRMIESVADEGWIRGGLPSRELTRDKNFSS